MSTIILPPRGLTLISSAGTGAAPGERGEARTPADDTRSDAGVGSRDPMWERRRYEEPVGEKLCLGPRSSPPSHRLLALVALGSRHEALHRDQMIQHGAMCRRFVAPPDGVEDPPVVLVRAGGSARGQQGLLAALRQQVHEG